MFERHATVAAPEGLHARPAARFVQTATAAGTAVTIARPGTGEPADARSILAVLSLDVRHGEEVVLRADGPDAEATLERLAVLLTEVEPTGGRGERDG